MLSGLDFFLYICLPLIWCKTGDCFRLENAKLSNKTTSKKDWPTVKGNMYATPQLESERSCWRTHKEVCFGAYNSSINLNWVLSQWGVQGELFQIKYIEYRFLAMNKYATVGNCNWNVPFHKKFIWEIAHCKYIICAHIHYCVNDLTN